MKMLPPVFGTIRRLMVPVLVACLLLPVVVSAQEVSPPVEEIIETEQDAFAPIDSVAVASPKAEAVITQRKTWSIPEPGMWEPDSLQHLRSRPGYGYMTWIDSLIRARKPEAPPVDASVKDPIPDASFLFRILLFVVLGVMVLWVVSHFLLGKKGLFTRGKTYEPAEMLEPETAVETADTNSLQKAMATGDYRRAVRLLFLMSLNHLHHQGYIALAPQKTNQHYLTEIADPALRKEFARMVLQYEYVWYGHFTLTADQFQRIHEPFKSFLRR